MTTITTRNANGEVIATREAERRFVRLNAQGEYTNRFGLKVRGRLAREQMDAELGARGFKRTTEQPDETGEYAFEEDPVLIQQAAQQRRLEQGIEDWNLHGVTGGRPLPKPTLADVAAGPWKPPVLPAPPVETLEQKVARLEQDLQGRQPRAQMPR